MTQLAGIAERAWSSIYGEQAVAIAGARCGRAPGAPDVPMLNRVVGLGVDRVVDDADLDAIEAAMEGTSFYVAVAPTADRKLDAKLADRGFEAGWGWMLFERPPVPPEPVRSSLVVREATEADSEAWAHIACEAYGLPVALDPWIASIISHPNWTGFLALDGDEPVALGALWVEDDAAYFGFGATLPAHRGKGGQAALFAARIERALAVGCTTLVTETGERRDERPSSSYRNILRQGFEERFVVSHRVRIRSTTSPSP